MNRGTKSSSLARLALSEIPTPNENATEIVALVKERGRIVGYQLETGQTINKEEAIDLARNGGIKGIGIAKRKDSYYLKSIPDSAEGNNLGNLPSITKPSY